MQDWAITLSIRLGSIRFPCTPTRTLTFHSTSTPSTSMTTRFCIPLGHSNNISHSRQLHLRSTTMVRSQRTRTPQWAPPSILQSITRRLGPLTPLRRLHRSRFMTTSICTLVVQTPICGTSDLCRTIPAIGPPTCPPQCSLNIYTIPPTKPCTTPSQVALLHQLRILPVLLSPCSTSTLLKSSTPSIRIHNRMV